jgi:transposase-like protein
MDFMLSMNRDTAAAKRFLQRTLEHSEPIGPRVINVMDMRHIRRLSLN